MTQPSRWWQDRAYVGGIIGLGPVDGSADAGVGEIAWPTAGYDEALVVWSPGQFQSGRPRADWFALADEMIARWTEWREQVRSAPDRLFTDP